VKDIDFKVIFVLGNSNKLRKMGLKGKIGWAFNVFTLLDLEIFNSENVKTKKYVHTNEHYYITWFYTSFLLKFSQLDQTNHLLS